jgi:hypothetical protein
MALTPWNYKDIILQCVAKYRAYLTIDYSVTRWFDDERKQNNSPEVDAYAEESSSIPLAIEHTKVESFSRQLLDDSRMLDLCGELERDLTPLVSSHVTLTLPTPAFRKGFDWRDALSRIKEYVLNLSSRLPTGPSTHSIEGVPFVFTLWKELAQPIGFFVFRKAPPQHQVTTELFASMQRALAHKRERLREYRATGARSVLILESLDIALVSHVTLYKSFLKAQKAVGTPHLDDVWLARTYDPNQIDWYCFLGPQALLDGVNLPNFRLGPKYASEWEEAMEG